MKNSIFKNILFVLFFILVPINILANKKSNSMPLPFGGPYYDVITVTKYHYSTRLNPHWFNQWGGLSNYYGGYAFLTINSYGGVSVKDNFYSKDKKLTNKHWITIDELYRGKGKKWKKNVYVEITFHYIIGGKEVKATGNGTFPFPENQHAYIVNGATDPSQVIDETPYVMESFLVGTFIKKRKGNFYIIRSNGKKLKGKRGRPLAAGDTVKTLDGTVEIVIARSILIKLKPHTQIIIPAVYTFPKLSIGFIDLTYGVLMAQAYKAKASLQIAVPQAITGTRGTKFELSHDPKVMKSCVRVYEHSVWFSDLQKRKTVIVHEEEESCVVNGGVPSDPKPYIKSKKASGQKVFHFSGTTQDNFPATLLLKIAKDGTISGIYSVKGSKFQKGKPCQLSARIPYRGKIEKSNLRAKGVLEATQAWCKGSKSIKQSIPATPFILSYKEGKGLLLDIGEQHYRVIFTKPDINPFQ